MHKPRAVIEVSLMDDGKQVYNVFKVLEAFNARVNGVISKLDCSPNDAVFSMTTASSASPSQVVDAGQRLCTVLQQSQDMQSVFAIMMQQPVPGAPQPVFPLLVKLDAPDAERLPWEVLWRQPPGAFFSLHPTRQWQIARMASGSARLLPLTRSVGPTLRMVVVLAAAQQDCIPEWSAVSDALKSLAMPAELFVIVSEKAAFAAVGKSFAAWTAEAGAGPARSGQVMYVGDQIDLLNAIQGFGPNVVHVFCHGVADPRPQLEIETRIDRTRLSSGGSIRLDATALSQIAGSQSLWLFVLNCCQGGKPGLNLHSLARDLVIAGAPAVVAMRESVSVIDANLFTEKFYNSLFPDLSRELATPAVAAAGPQGYPISESLWVSALFDARQHLSTLEGRQADSSPQWTYPVMYVNRDELRLIAPQPAPAAGAPAAMSDDDKRALRYKLDMLQQLRAPMLVLPVENAVNIAFFDEEIGRARAQLGMPVESVTP